MIFTPFIDQLKSISTVLNNTGDINKLLTSFSALDVAQQKVLLSSNLLTEEQKQQCLAMTMLSSANAKYTADQLIKTTGISSEVLATWGLTKATDSLTFSQLAELAASDKQAKAVLEKIIAQNAATVSIGKVTASNITLAASESSATIATGAFTTAIKANIAAMKTWLTTTPLGWFTLAATSLAAVIGLVDLFTTSIKEQTEIMEEARSGYDEVHTELSNITKELKAQENELNLLLSKDKLTYAEKGQLEELQKITAELRIQEDLAKRNEEQAAKKLAKESSKLFQKQYGKYDISEDAIHAYQNDATFTGNNAALFSDENDISAMIAGYKQVQLLLEDAYATGDTYGIEHFESLTEELDHIIFSTASALQEQKNNISDYYDLIRDIPYNQLSAEQKEIADSYHNISDAIALIYKQLSPNVWNDMQIDALFHTKGIEKTKDELIDLAVLGKLTPEMLESYDILNQTLQESRLVLEDGQTAAEALCNELYALAEAKKLVDNTPLSISFSDIFALEDADGKATALGDLQEKIDELQTAWKGLKEITDSFNKTGKITIDQFQELLSFGDEYLKYLIDENGNIDLQTKSLQNLSAAYIENSKTKILNELVSQITSITSEAQAQEFLKQKVNDTTTALEELNEELLENWMLNLANTDITAQSAKQITDYYAAVQNALNSLGDAIDVGSFYGNVEQDTKKYIDAYMNYMKASLDAGKIDYQTYSREVAAFLKEMFDKGKLAAADYHEYTKQMLEVQQSAMDKVISAVIRRLDLEIKSYKEQIDHVEERYQKEIDYIDTLIEQHEEQKQKLQEENDELERQRNLEKALYELERAKTQRINKLYTGEKGYIYTAAGDAIRDSSDNVRKAKLDAAIADIDASIKKLEEQQKSLQEALDTEKEQLQEIIDNLSEYRDKWQEVADEYEIRQNELMANQILGADWEKNILDGRTDVLENFKNQYISIQQAIIDAAWNSANEQIKAAKEAEKASAGSQGSASKVEDTSFHSDPYLDSLVTDDVGKNVGQNLDTIKQNQKWYAVDKNGNKVSQGYSTKEELLEEYGARIRNGHLSAKQFATGGKNLKEQLAWTNEYGKEAILSPSRNAILTPIENQDSVLNPEMTKNLWRWAEINPNMFKSLIDFKGYANTPMNRDVQSVSVNIGDIQLYGVQDVNDLGNQIVKRLPNVMLQAINKR